jgi:hypothetical protein
MVISGSRELHTESLRHRLPKQQRRFERSSTSLRRIASSCLDQAILGSGGRTRDFLELSDQGIRRPVIQVHIRGDRSSTFGPPPKSRLTLQVERENSVRVWSRGLGRVELAADLERVKVIYDGGTLFLVGKSEPPVSWDFVVSLDSAELWKVTRLAFNRPGMGFMLRYFKLRLFDRKQLAAHRAKSTTPRVGTNPDRDYAPVIAKTRPQKQPTTR